jgi:hypothetical protein
VPIAGGVVAGIGNVTLRITDTFSLSGIALGTILVLAGYHALRLAAPAHLHEREAPGGG